MTIPDILRSRAPLFDTAEPGAGAGGTPPADPPAGGTPPADPPADPPAGGTPPADPPAGGTPWWQGDTLAEHQRETLTALGLTVDDPVAAVAKLVDMERAAKAKLKASPDSLIPKPKEGQALSEWMAENRAAFGLPEDADGYQIERPEAFQNNDALWDGKLEQTARELAVKHALPPEALQDFTALYADRIGALAGQVETQAEAANAEMMQALEREWGDQTPARMARARQAAQAMAEKAGLDGDGLDAVAGLLAQKTGDAATIRMFAAIGEAMGEDSAAGLGKGAGGFGTTPAEARAELARLRGADGDYAKAVAANDRAALARLQPHIERLTKLAAQG